MVFHFFPKKPNQDSPSEITNVMLASPCSCAQILKNHYRVKIQN